MGKTLMWLKEKRHELVPYFQQKRPCCSPWWIVIAVVHPLVVERVEKTFVQLQGDGYVGV
jgi:hypothetical protein